MDFSKIHLKKEFNISKLITLHYYEFEKNFVSKGERHNFWEFLYVDEGEVEVVSEEKGYLLTQGDIIFHKPNEFHSVWANKKTTANVLVICFDCDSENMSYFKNRVFIMADEERNLLSLILKEAYNAFNSPLGDSEKNMLHKKKEYIFGSEQLIKSYLEILLITMIRNWEGLTQDSKLSSVAKERNDLESIQGLISYIENNYQENFTLGDFCYYTNMSKTHLTEAFKKLVGLGAVQYLRKIKIDRAKLLIREGNYNISEISKILGYSSIHYFSRYFKKMVGYAPSEYTKSIMARI